MHLIPLLLSILICFSVFSVFVPTSIVHNASGHIFISDDDASSILTLLEKLKVEALMGNNTMIQNMTKSQEHLTKLIDSIDDISDSENEFDFNSEQFDNSTVNALLFANLVDEVLRNYGMSYGISPTIMTNMSYLSTPDLPDTTNKTGSLVDVDKYMISKEYFKRASETYDSTLRIFEDRMNKNSLNSLGEHITDLGYLIDNKTNPIEIMNIVHTKIHPELQTAFNLTLRP